MSSRYLARQFAKKLGISYKEYRKMLSTLREKINVLERLMSANKWDEIEFDKLPSKAGFKYSKAFMTRPETAERYYRFMHSDTTKVNSKTLYPYEIVQKCMSRWEYTDDEVLQKYWENLPNYFGDDEKSAICVVDVSGSMRGTPMSVSISLGIYCAERLNGPFKDLFITFSENPKVEKLRGKKITTRVNNMESANWGYNTNLKAVFDLLLDIAKKPGVKPEDIPQSLIIISDMEIDSATSNRGGYYSGANYHKPSYMSDMEFIRKQWEDAGFKMPHLIYWNVNARNDTILDKGDNITCVSGLSASTFEMILSGKTGINVMLDKLMSERYVPVHF